MKPKGGETLWREAKTFAEMCELVALYIEGHLDFFPGHSGSTASETDGISTYLLKFNRAGFMTICSQPGEIEDDEKQRAWVEGFTLLPTARKLDTLGLYSDLIVLTFAPGFGGGYQIPITVSEYYPFTWAGGHSPDVQLEVFEQVCSASGFAALLGTCYTVIIDPSWGRNDYLWDRVLKELDGSADASYSPDPHPNLALGIDFLGLPSDD